MKIRKRVSRLEGIDKRERETYVNLGLQKASLSLGCATDTDPKEIQVSRVKWRIVGDRDGRGNWCERLR